MAFQPEKSPLLQHDDKVTRTMMTSPDYEPGKQTAKKRSFSQYIRFAFLLFALANIAPWLYKKITNYWGANQNTFKLELPSVDNLPQIEQAIEQTTDSATSLVNTAPPLQDKELTAAEEQEKKSDSCLLRLKKSITLYKNGKYAASQEPLLDIIDGAESPCLNDALYQLGITSLQLNEADAALGYFARVQNPAKYGGDIAWYMAVAIAMKAKENPRFKSKAKKALEQAMNYPQTPERKAEMERILADL